VVWVGYDDNTVMGLTGGLGALPVWIALTKPTATMFLNEVLPSPHGAFTASTRLSLP